MNSHRDRQRKILKKLSRLVEELSQASDAAPSQGNDDESASCVLLSLPDALQERAAQTAIEHNPLNAASLTALRGLAGSEPGPQELRIAVTVDRYWGPSQRKLTVSFLEQTPRDLRERIISHMNAWNKTAGISFDYVTGQGNVRITRSGREYKSYIGTDIRHINPNFPTMWLGGFTMSTPESEYRRVVRHETGHTLGFPHEHMRKELVARLDPQKCYIYYRRFGWDKRMVDSQVLTPISGMSIFATDPDESSIMCYQVPGSCTRDGKPILGGSDINDTDYWFAGRIYPKASAGQGRLPSRSMSASPPEESHHADDSEVDLSQYTMTPLDL